MDAAPGDELAQVQRVRLSCQPAIPASASRSASVKAGWRGTRAVVVAVIGYLPVRAETDEARPVMASATTKVTTIKPPCPLPAVTVRRGAEPRAAPGNAPNRRIGIRQERDGSRSGARRSPGYASVSSVVVFVAAAPPAHRLIAFVPAPGHAVKDRVLPPGAPGRLLGVGRPPRNLAQCPVGAMLWLRWKTLSGS